jgi:hypothetical protein
MIRWLVLACAQVFAIWLVIQLWRRIGPVVGLPGLALWLGGCYWLAHRLDLEAEQRFLDEIKRRGWGPPK